MNLIVTIPAYNEEGTINQVINNVSRNINGVNDVKVFVTNDGSTDNTEAVALEAGADKVFNNMRNLGLAKTFERGLSEAIKSGADIIVNIDADGQHDPREIEKIIQPIVEKKSDIVIGDREIKKLNNMKWGNKYGNISGSWIIKKLTGQNINDASCGFRAYSREAALKLNIYHNHTYVHETIIQASFKNLKTENVPIEVKARISGKSKLITNLFSHIKRSSSIILRTVLMYKPLKFLSYLGFAIIIPGILLGLRVAYYYFIGQGGGRLHSLILTAILIIVGFNIIVLGLIGDLISNGRKINEEILYYTKKNNSK